MKMVVNEYDRTYIGNPYIPQIVYGFGASFQYKNWDFCILPGWESLSLGYSVNVPKIRWHMKMMAHHHFLCHFIVVFRCFLT